MSEKAKYRVLRLSHIHNKLWEEGEEVEYDGIPGSALEPLNDAAIQAKAAIKSGLVITAPVSANAGSESTHTDSDLEKLREEYEVLFGEKPHFNTVAKTLKEKIDEQRQKLGV